MLNNLLDQTKVISQQIENIKIDVRYFLESKGLSLHAMRHQDEQRIGFVRVFKEPEDQKATVKTVAVLHLDNLDSLDGELSNAIKIALHHNDLFWSVINYNEEFFKHQCDLKIFEA